METLTDYVKWMGNLDFDQSPLRAADAMILCVISYFDLSPVFGDGRKSVPVSDCVQMIEEGRARLIITGGDLGNLALFDAAVRTKRFGSLIMSDYTDISQTEPPLQFSAVTFTHRDSFSFIAFRGTDSSLAGWKENFMISFTKTRAQQLAEIYAADRISRGGNWYIAGHSKGGNLALYAACRLSDEELARVLHVYILDGPGLCPEVMDTELIRRVDPVTTCIIPEFDVIGKLFEPGITDTRIVKSFRDGLLQHSLPSWLIDHGELATAEKNTSRSLRLNEVMDSWIENRPPEERAIFIDELFEALDKAGVTDFSRMTLESLADTMLTLRNASETTRATLADLGSRAFHVNELELPPEALPVAEEIQKVIESAGSEETREKRKAWIRRFREEPMFRQSVLLIPTGILLALVSEPLINAAALILIVLLTALQGWLTYRRLKRTGWKLGEEKGNVYLLFIMAALLSCLFIREQAMFFFGSVFFGVLLLISAYQSSETAMKTDGGLTKVFFFTESAIQALFGVSIIIASEPVIASYARVSGILMIIDGLIRIGYYYKNIHDKI